MKHEQGTSFKITLVLYSTVRQSVIKYSGLEMNAIFITYHI